MSACEYLWAGLAAVVLVDLVLSGVPVGGGIMPMTMWVAHA